MRTSGVVPLGESGGLCLSEVSCRRTGDRSRVADPARRRQFTVRVTVTVWISDPAVPVTVTA